MLDRSEVSADRGWCATELDETLSIPAKATLEQIDVSLKSFIYFGARYYRAQTPPRNDVRS